MAFNPPNWSETGQSFAKFNDSWTRCVLGRCKPLLDSGEWSVAWCRTLLRVAKLFRFLIQNCRLPNYTLTFVTQPHSNYYCQFLSNQSMFLEITPGLAGFLEVLPKKNVWGLMVGDILQARNPQSPNQRDGVKALNGNTCCTNVVILHNDSTVSTLTAVTEQFGFIVYCHIHLYICYGRKV